MAPREERKEARRKVHLVWSVVALPTPKLHGRSDAPARTSNHGPWRLASFAWTLAGLALPCIYVPYPEVCLGCAPARNCSREEVGQGKRVEKVCCRHQCALPLARRSGQRQGRIEWTAEVDPQQPSIDPCNLPSTLLYMFYTRDGMQNVLVNANDHAKLCPSTHRVAPSVRDPPEPSRAKLSSRLRCRYVSIALLLSSLSRLEV